MRKQITTTLSGLALAAAATTALSAPASATPAGPQCRQDARSRQVSVVGLTYDQRLICFDAAHPGRAKATKPISGLAGDTALVGIDYRPATKQLYGLGNSGGVYTIDVGGAAAKKTTQLRAALHGTAFGVDFNPVVDRLRVISDTGQNVAANVVDGTVTAGTALNTGPNTPTSTGVTGAAYTNNDADPATGTTLFDIDTTGDQVVIQSPPNAGSLVPTGKLGVDAGSAVGFDIASTVRGGTTQSVRGFASLTVGGTSGFYRIDLLTGRAGKVGSFNRQVTDIAIPLP